MTMTKMMTIIVMNLNPVKDSCGREEKKGDEKILVDADARHLKAPGDGDSYNYDKILVDPA